MVGINPDFHAFVIPGVGGSLETLLVFLEAGNALPGALDVVPGLIVGEPALLVADSASVPMMSGNVA